MADGQSEVGDDQTPQHSGRISRSLVIKLIVLAAVVGLFVFLFVQYGDDLTLSSLARHSARATEFQKQHPIGVLAVAFLIYVAVTGLSLPGAAVLTLSYAWFFKTAYGPVLGFTIAVVLISFASTAGATFAFLLSRYLIRDTIKRRFEKRLAKFDDALEKDGAYFLFTLRLIPAVPFFVINLVMGVTPIRVWTFWWVSQLGMLAGTCVYVFAGVQIPTAEQLAEQGVGGIITWELVVAFVLLGVFPLAVKKLLGRHAPKPVEESPDASKDNDS